jgi:hypothetical protein
MSHFDPAEPFALFLRKRRGRTATLRSRQFDNINVEAGITVDGIAAQAANESAAHAIQQLRWVGGQSQWVFNLQMGLGTILRFSDPRRETWELPCTRLTHELLAEVYAALGRAIRWGTSDSRLGKIEIQHLTEGLLAAARLVEAIDKEDFSGDRHKDDKSRVKVLIHYARIAEHRQEIEQRRRDREHGTFEALLGTAEEANIFG